MVTNKKSEAEIVRFRTEELLRRHQIELDVPPTLLDVLLRSFADYRVLLFGMLMVLMMIWRPRGLIRINRIGIAPRKGVAP